MKTFLLIFTGGVCCENVGGSVTGKTKHEEKLGFGIGFEETRGTHGVEFKDF